MKSDHKMTAAAATAAPEGKGEGTGKRYHRQHQGLRQQMVLRRARLRTTRRSGHRRMEVVSRPTRLHQPYSERQHRS